LSNSTLISSHGVLQSELVHDSVVSEDGGIWNSHLASIFSSTDSYVVYDLGESHNLKAGYIQADNNDYYDVSISDDSINWRTLWTVPAVNEPGLRPRIAKFNDKARFIKVSAIDGDGSFSITELQLFCQTPQGMPFNTLRNLGVARGEILLSHLKLLLGLILFAALLNFKPKNETLLSKGLSFLSALAHLTAIYFFVELLLLFLNGYGFGYMQIAFSKALIAAAALGILFLSMLKRESLSFRNISLSILAALSIFAYTNYGELHFTNHISGKKTFVHLFDMRVYFPTAKYFPELKYDGLYLGSLAAYLEDKFPGWRDKPELEEQIRYDLKGVRVRDLHDYTVTTADTLFPEIREFPDRFSSNRWEEFLQDMIWFVRTMGDSDYLGTLADHGGNAAPGWMFLSYLLFNNFDASQLSLTLLGLIDPLLLILLFVSIARTFGLQTALVAAIIFGTTDFAKFGATLVGSTLRYDWFCALGFAACAIKVRRYFLGGALLGLSAMIRVFPVAALVGVVLCSIYALGRDIFSRRIFNPKKLWIRHRAPIHIGVGGAAVIAALFIGSTALFSYPNSWGMWLSKIGHHATKPNVNHVALRTIVGYKPELVAQKIMQKDNPEPWIKWQEEQKNTLEQRSLYLKLGTFFGLGLIFLAARRKRLYQAAMLGMLLVPFISYPANYYYHYIALLPLVAPFVANRRYLPNLVSISLLLVCALQYRTLLEPWADVCFTWQSFLLLGAFVFIPLTFIVSQTILARQCKA
ncbi:MAG: discoidin domain-containing protein, partial [Deltaproteobacteria bacterium]|nr:discoidin domain-containing protein [Deltaproteobacteria bacterium]